MASWRWWGTICPAKVIAKAFNAEIAAVRPAERLVYPIKMS
jgi:hypothetical protein